MTEGLLTPPDRKEALSFCYVRAVAAGAGYTVAPGGYPDRDGIDLQIRGGGTMYPALDLQMKATVTLGDAAEGFFRFRLKRRNYDLLRGEAQTPRLLVVFDLPPDPDDWMTITPEELVLRRCAYWVKLRGCGSTRNTDTVTIRIPTRNQFDICALRRLMELSRSGGFP